VEGEGVVPGEGGRLEIEEVYRRMVDKLSVTG
jgi:hypothetical protein